MALNHMGMLCFTGMSYIVRKSTLDKFGGLARFGKFLAEDFFFSKELFDKCVVYFSMLHLVLMRNYLKAATRIFTLNVSVFL